MTFVARLFRCFALVAGLAALSGSVHAACSGPSGDAGDVRYATNYNTLAFCDGTDWRSMAGSTGGGGGADNLGNHTASQALNMATFDITNGGTITGTGGVFGGLTVTGQASITIISTTYVHFQSPTTVLACSSGIAGAMRYTSGTMQVCDGSNWGNIGIGVPAGTIAAFNSSSCPAGWTEYTAARGRFLRGIDNGAGIDPDGTRAPGNQQADAMQQITGSMGFNRTAAGNPVGAFVAGGSPVSSGATPGSSAAGSIGFNSANSPGARTSTETRPSNVAVIFCSYSGFQSAPGQTILTTLASLTDVNVTGASTGQVLTYSGGTWIASDSTAGGGALGDRIISGTTSVIASQDRSVTVFTAGAPRMVVGENGNISIGSLANNDATKLFVFSNSVTPDSNGSGQLAIGASGYQGFIALDGTAMHVGHNSAIRRLDFMTDETTRMAITAGGNVGIGNTNSLAKLDVVGTISASDAIQVGASSLACSAGIPGALRYVGGTGIQFCNTSSWMTLSTGIVASNTGAVQFNANGTAFGGDTANFFWDNANKRLGIGTTTPSTSLYVNGQIAGGFGAVATSGVLDFNDATNAMAGSGYTLLRGSTASNAPNSTTNYWHPFSFEYASKTGSGNLTQFAIPYTLSSGMYLRVRTSGTWSAWNKFVVEDASGNAVITNNITAVAFLYSSDRRMKENIRKMSGGLVNLDSLNPVTFNYIADTTKRERLGLIAQDVEKVYPQAVVTDEKTGMKSVDYPSLVPVLIEAAKELKAENAKLRGDYDALLKRVEALERKN